LDTLHCIFKVVGKKTQYQPEEFFPRLLRIWRNYELIFQQNLLRTLLLRRVNAPQYSDFFFRRDCTKSPLDSSSIVQHRVSAI